ncbi:MAG TPA: hypothetical protein VII56_17620 [Rhizomicrobium sp.]
MRHSTSNSRRNLYTAAAWAFAALAVTGCSPPGSKIPSDVATVTTCSVPDTTLQTWFKKNVVAKDAEVTPADSINFANSPNCSFYVWSARMFLWAMSPTPASYGGGSGRIFSSPTFFDVSPADANNVRTLIKQAGGLLHFQMRDAQKGPHDLALIHDRRSGRLFEVLPTTRGANNLQQIRNTAGQLVEIQRAEFKPGAIPTLFDANDRTISFVLNRERKLTLHEIPAVQRFNFNGHGIFIGGFGEVLEAEQAEADDGVVVGQNSTGANNSLIYYTITVNDVFGYLASGVNAGQITASSFPLTAADETPIQTYAGTKGVTSFPDPEALAIEMKTAWVEAVNLPANCNYITMQAQIPDYDTTDPAHWKVKPNPRTATLAMIGTHIVGSAAGHAEMIWATFEHVCNTPNSGYTYNSTSASNQPGPAETGPWELSSTDTPNPPNVKRQSYDGSVNPAQINENPLQSTYPHTIGPADIERTFPWGMPGSNAGSNTEVLATNQTTLQQMLGLGDLRGNYIMTGATWTIGGQVNGIQVGTSQLANTAMETYQQGSNCFDCHNNPTNDPKGGLGLSDGSGLSHIFGELKPLP